MTILQVYSFSYNANETLPALRFPELAGRAYSFSITVNSVAYEIRVSYNVWTNNGMVSVYDSNGNPVIMNTPLIEAFDDAQPNFLYTNEFSGYSLIWSSDQGGFAFGTI